MLTHWTPLKFIMAVLVVLHLVLALFTGEGAFLVPVALFGVLFLALSVNKIVDDRKK
jgi:hypothetical protein